MFGAKLEKVRCGIVFIHYELWSAYSVFSNVIRIALANSNMLTLSVQSVPEQSRGGRGIATIITPPTRFA